MMDAPKLLINLLYRAVAQSSEVPGWSHRQTKNNPDRLWRQQDRGDEAKDHATRTEHVSHKRNDNTLRRFCNDLAAITALKAEIVQ